MRQKLYWGIVTLIILMITFTTFVYLNTRSHNRQYEREIVEINQKLKESKQAKHEQLINNNQTETELTKASTESITTDTDKTTKDNINPPINGIQTIHNPVTESNIESVEVVRMSPHGFGPYPKIPDSAPIPEFEESDDVDTELMLRVAVKAWNEGERFDSGFYDSSRGRVYLQYSDVTYVEYSDEIDEKTGKNKIIGVSATSDNKGIGKMIFDGNIPPGIKLIDIEETGINPYEYLDLP